MRKLLRRTASPDTSFDFKRELGGYEPPTFPTLVSNALDLLTDPEVHMSAVSQIIELDPGVSARVLRMVNSASMAPRTRVTSVQQAAMMLGRNQLEALLISAGAGSVIPRPRCEHYDHSRFWTTAAKRATLAGLLAGRVDPTRRSENFTAALLQDMAVPVLALCAEPYSSILDTWHGSSEDLVELEIDGLGWHHGQVGAWMSSLWGFPTELVEFLTDHHETADPALHPAHVAATIREVGEWGDERTVERGTALLGLPADDMVALIAQAEASAIELANLLV